MLNALLLGLLPILPSAAAAQSVPVLSSTPVLGGECCPGTVWTPDSAALLFLDGPPARQATGIYRVSANGGPVTRQFSNVAFFSPSLKWAVRPGDPTTLENLTSNKRFTLPTAGANVTWSPSEAQVAYSVGQTSGNYDRRASRIYVAPVFGQPRQVATLYGGGVNAWLDQKRLLLSGKLSPGTRDRQLWTQDVGSGKRVVLGAALNFGGLSVSPGGRWVAYYVAFDSLSRNGLFVQPTAGGARRKLDVFGSYRWRGDDQLVFIPLSAGGGPHTLRQYTLSTGQWRTLGSLGDQVRQGDWSVSPDGKKLSYLSAKDGNVRVVALPE
ncbi:hypothetical protein [Deinococcus sp.]|uniref:TolB family protein n=1 Tax=Deinococcus sp. TaxID=47478 RepID=UPI0025D8A221|nr:hypothetical protein [Deinococcus sp.]